MSTLGKGIERSLYTKMDLSSTAAELQQACAARNAEQMATYLAENVVAMYFEQPLIVGREANRLAWTGLFEAPDLVNPIAVDEVVESEQGDLGYTFGRWWQRQPSEGKQSGGRWVAVWQPVGGAWQITHLSSNGHSDIASEFPAAQAPGGAEAASQ